MIWLALAFALTAWACVAAYGIWAWRDDRYAARAEKRAEQERLNASFDSIQRLILQWTKIRETAAAPSHHVEITQPFPAGGDNFTTIPKSDVVVEFGKRPKPEGGGDSVA